MKARMKSFGRERAIFRSNGYRDGRHNSSVIAAPCTINQDSWNKRRRKDWAAGRGRRTGPLVAIAKSARVASPGGLRDGEETPFFLLLSSARLYLRVPAVPVERRPASCCYKSDGNAERCVRTRASVVLALNLICVEQTPPPNPPPPTGET